MYGAGAIGLNIPFTGLEVYLSIMSFNLSPAVGIIMGANIGTVITSVLVGLKISKYAVYFIIIGAFVSMFSKNKKTKYLSQIIFVFGCLFYGLDLMGNNLSMISEVPEFTTKSKNNL